MTRYCPYVWAGNAARIGDGKLLHEAHVIELNVHCKKKAKQQQQQPKTKHFDVIIYFYFIIWIVAL